MCQQASEQLNETEIKANIREYLRMMRRKQSDWQKREKIDKYIKCLICDDKANNNDNLVHFLHVLRNEIFDGLSVEGSNTDNEEWHIQTEEIPSQLNYLTQNLLRRKSFNHQIKIYIGAMIFYIT